ncbi:MAG: glucoamylase family protein [Acidobacteriaceae bacterium]
MLVLGSPAASLAEGLQNQEQAPPVKPGQQPTTETQAAQKYKQGPGVFINRPFTQISKEADALLDDLEGRGCDYFYNEVGLKSGLVRDRAPATGLSLSRVSSIAATGFGLTALCIAAKRNYLLPSLCEQRVEQTLAFLLEECPHEHGFLYHFIDLNSGERVFGSEVSSIDTSLLLCGVLTCRQYFAGNARIAALATTFYRRIDWQWMLNGGTSLSMGWLPDQGFLKHRWDIYSELMTMYLMAIGSPTHPIPAGLWDELERPVIEYSGIQYISGVAPLFIHQYAHAWCDFRDKRDLHTNYFTNSIAATRCHQLWCLVLGRKFNWIDQDLWGITASDSRNGYRVWGGPPTMGSPNGTLVPCATAGSLPFLPPECSHVLLSMKKDIGEKVYTKYGFVDAFDPKTKWFAQDILGIDQGISVLMAENLRSGFVWQYFMKNPEIVKAMGAVQFHPDPDANRQVL